MAAVLACRPAVASHFSAAYLWGLLRSRPGGRFHLTAPTQRRPKPLFVVHEARLSPVDVAVVDGIPVTGVARTLLDLAAMLPEGRLQGVLERAEELQILDLGPVEELLACAPHHPGTAKLRHALTIYRPEPAFTRSGLEKRFLALVREAGLPLPAMNYVAEGFELDAYWEQERFVVELDVFETHGSHVAFDRDRERQDDLLLAGIEMIRVTGPRLKREPRKVMDRLAAHLERRRRGSL